VIRIKKQGRQWPGNMIQSHRKRRRMRKRQRRRKGINVTDC
jgi:hypothetical protein